MESVVTMAQALAHLSRGAVRYRVATACWQQPHRSVLVTHNGPITPAQRRWIAVLAAGDQAVLAGLNAAEAGGLRGYGDDRMHILVPARRQPEQQVAPDVVLHRSSQLDAADVLANAHPPRTRMARSVIDAAQWARTDDQARAVVAAAFQQRLVTLRNVQAVLSRLHRARRR